jgi:hypothetical protein
MTSDPVAEICERFKRGQSVADSYAHGGGEVRFHMRVGASWLDREPEGLCALLQRTPKNRRLQAHVAGRDAVVGDEVLAMERPAP